MKTACSTPRILLQHICQISSFQCRSRLWKVVSFSFHWDKSSKELGSRYRLKFKQPPAFWTIYPKIYEIYGPYDNRGFSGKKRCRVQFMAITYGRNIPLTHWILGHATSNKESHIFWEMVPGMLLGLLEMQCLTMGHQLRTVPYELDISEPPSHRLDRSSCKLEMVHLRLNTSKDKEHKQAAQASSPDPPCYPEPLPQCTPLVTWVVLFDQLMME